MRDLREATSGCQRSVIIKIYQPRKMVGKDFIISCFETWLNFVFRFQTLFEGSAERNIRGLSRKNQLQHRCTLRVQKYEIVGLKHGGKDVLWPMSLIIKGDFLPSPDLNLNTNARKICVILSSVYQTNKNKFLRNKL